MSLPFRISKYSARFAGRGDSVAQRTFSEVSPHESSRLWAQTEEKDTPASRAGSSGSGFPNDASYVDSVGLRFDCSSSLQLPLRSLTRSFSNTWESPSAIPGAEIVRLRVRITPPIINAGCTSVAWTRRLWACSLGGWAHLKLFSASIPKACETLEFPLPHGRPESANANRRDARIDPTQQL